MIYSERLFIDLAILTRDKNPEVTGDENMFLLKHKYHFGISEHPWKPGPHAMALTAMMGYHRLQEKRKH